MRLGGGAVSQLAAVAVRRHGAPIATFKSRVPTTRRTGAAACSFGSRQSDRSRNMAPLAVGDTLPDIAIKTFTADGIQDLQTGDLFAGKKVGTLCCACGAVGVGCRRVVEGARGSQVRGARGPGP